MKKFILLLFLFSIVSLSCKKQDPTPPAQITLEDVFEDFKKLEFTKGVHDVKLEVAHGIFWNFRIIAPKQEPNVEYPLVIALHWASNGDPDIHKTTDCYIEPGLADLEAFIISPNGGKEIWSDLNNQKMVLNLTNFARSTWPIDKDKVLVTGYSNGGNGSWFFGETQPSLFSAAIPLASSYTTIHPDGSVRKMPIPMYVIHGEKDELFPLAQTQEWIEQSNAVGSRIKLVVAKDLSHVQACSYVSYLKDGVKWVQDSVWQ